MAVEILSFDCISPSSSCLKIYAKTHDASFSNLLNIFTLGGTSDSPYATETIKALEKFWKSILLLGDDWSDYDSQSAEFLYFCFVISPGKSEPDIMVNVPSWTLGIDKTGLTRGLRRCFRELGCDAGRSHKSDVLNLLWVNLVSYLILELDDWLCVRGGTDEQERGVFTYFSFVYDEKGPEVTTSCAPKIAP